MTKMITILGEPMGKQRPKATQINGYTRVYTPAQTINYETLIKLEYNTQGGEFFDKGIALRLNVHCYYPIPQSFSNKKQGLCMIGKIMPLVKPDIDNVAKTIMDALNGVAYNDDKQVTHLCIIKQYGTQPKVEFSLEAIDGFTK